MADTVSNTYKCHAMPIDQNYAPRISYMYTYFIIETFHGIVAHH